MSDELKLQGGGAGPARKGDPDRMGKERVGKLLVEFSVSALIMMIFNSLYNIIDTVLLQIAVPGVGAVVTQLAFPVMSILMGCSIHARSCCELKHLISNSAWSRWAIFWCRTALLV